MPGDLLQERRGKIDVHPVAHGLYPSHIEAVGRIERGPTSKAAHLLAEHTGLARGIFRFIVDDCEFLMRGDSGLPHDRQMVRQFGFAAQAAIGPVLHFLEFGQERAGRLLGGELRPTVRLRLLGFERELGRRRMRSDSRLSSK
jgi:hypothetical protein